MYGLIGTLITTLDISANEEDKAYYQSLNYGRASVSYPVDP